MMKYFAIEYSSNEKLVGKIPQTKEYVHHCDIWNDSNFIDKYYYRKIEDKPILSNLVLYANAKLTDLINSGASMGFSFFSIVISDSFKNLLEQFNCFSIQFFSTYIIQKDENINNYWQTHIYDFPYDFIDFNKTKILLKDRDVNRNVISEYLDINKKEDFLNLSLSLKYPKMITLEDLHFNDDMNLDYFAIRFFENGGSYGVVSERLKNAIEQQGITGVEFRPIELSLQDWYHSGEREKVYGKSY